MVLARHSGFKIILDGNYWINMFFRTCISILFYILVTSFVIALHTGLFSKVLVQREVCITKHGWASCTSPQKIKATNVLLTEAREITYWERVFEYSSFFPSIVSFLVFAGFADWATNKEKIGLYVVSVLGLQSLIFMILVMVHHSKLEYLLCGVLLNVLIGDLPGSGIIALVFAVAITGQDSTRTLLFIYIEAMVYIGTSVGTFAAENLPNYLSLTYIFVLSFTLSVICFQIVYFGFPSHVSILKRNTEIQNQSGKTQEYGVCKHPFNSIRNEYIAGIILAVGLTELGKYGYKAVINSLVTLPPINMSPEMASLFIFTTTAIQGWVSIFLGIFLIKSLYASDNMLAMISISSAAFWMALTGFAGSETMLYVLSCCLAVFVPLAMASLRSAATKEADVAAGNVIMVLAILGFITMLCKAVTMYNSERFISANTVNRQLCLLLFSLSELMAFIVIGSISLTFNKPIVELKKKNVMEQSNDGTDTDTEDEIYSCQNPLLKKTNARFL